MFSEDPPLPTPPGAKIQRSLNIEAVCFWLKSKKCVQFTNDVTRKATVVWTDLVWLWCNNYFNLHSHASLRYCKQILSLCKTPSFQIRYVQTQPHIFFLSLYIFTNTGTWQRPLPPSMSVMSHATDQNIYGSGGRLPRTERGAWGSSPGSKVARALRWPLTSI